MFGWIKRLFTPDPNDSFLTGGKRLSTEGKALRPRFPDPPPTPYEQKEGLLPRRGPHPHAPKNIRQAALRAVDREEARRRDDDILSPTNMLSPLNPLSPIHSSYDPGPSSDCAPSSYDSGSSSSDSGGSCGSND